MMKRILNKLASRKLWAAILGTITGLALIFGLDEETANTACGAVVTLVSLVTYIVTEGKIDICARNEKLQALLKQEKEKENENQ
ncbi:MAG: hypothetical protein E7449_01385 [Ruminococcaceae bacterium]|nr:hypothetical protein [Oscillospiraceae bacterium]